MQDTEWIFRWNNQCYKWKVDKQNDGTFLIENVSDKYLRVDGENIIVHYNFGDDTVKFDICRESSGVYQGKYTIKNGDKYLTRSNTSLTLTSTAISGSYWTFMEVTKGNMYSTGYNYGDDFDTTSIPTDLSDYFGSFGYNTLSHVSGVSAQTVLNYMKTSDIAILTGLGQAGAIITNPNGTRDSMIMADYELTQGNMQSYLHDLPNNALAGTRCVIYLSSASGVDATGNDGESYNLVKATYDKGAHFVLGFKTAVTDNMINDWITCFYGELINEVTIKEAVQNACITIGLGNSTSYHNYVYVLGDGNQYLNF